MLNKESKSKRKQPTNTGNEIRLGGVRALSDALKVNTTLTTLDLGGV